MKVHCSDLRALNIPPTGINIKNECELNAGDKDSLNVLKQDLNQINCLTKHSRRVLSR